MQQDGLRAGFNDRINNLRGQFLFALYDDGITLDRRNLTGVLIYEILYPRLHHITGQFTSDTCLKRLFVYLHFLCEVEAVQNLFVRLKTDSTKQGCYRQFLLTVDVSVHDLVDIGSEFDP